MKVELQCGDTITIPEGCKATIKDGSVVFEKEEKLQDFKDGDILIITENEHRYCVFIYKNTDGCGFHSFYVGINTGNTLTISKSLWQKWGNDALLDYATDKEKQELFDKMKEQGLRWNARTKQIERIRNRVKFGHEYLFINSFGVVAKVPEYNDPQDDNRYNVGNYYLLEERVYAEKDAAEIRAIFEKRIKV